MKTLFLIRHAKSSHGDPGLTDFERPLNDRGLRDAPAMGRHLNEVVRFMPDVIISSPAIRAITTAKAIAREINFNEDFIIQEKCVYEATVETLVDLVRDLPHTYGYTCIVGHNPGLEEFVTWLCGAPPPGGLVTSGVAVIDLSIITWDEVMAGKGYLRNFVYPALIGLEKI